MSTVYTCVTLNCIVYTVIYLYTFIHTRICMIYYIHGLENVIDSKVQI